MERLKLLLSSLMMLALVQVSAQNPPILGTQNDDTLFLNSGADFLLISDVDDGEAGFDQDITITAQSDNDAVVEVTGVEYTAGNTFAVIRVDVKDSVNTANISITADDPDGQATADFDVAVVPYSKPGVHFEVFDIIFWQQVDPINETSAYDTVIATTHFNQNSINWDNITLNVSVPSGGCTWCDGHDFSTTMISGYIVPSETGQYRFYNEHQAADMVAISTDESFDNCQTIIHVGQSIGSDQGNDTWRSDLISLEAGKIYAFYAVYWNVHQENSKLYWESASIAKSVIPSENLMSNYDPVKPTLSSDIQIFKIGDEDLLLTWTEGSDDQILSGYNVYVNGVKANTSIIKDTSYLVEGLTPDTKYSVAMIAVDDMGNESDISNILTTTTYASDGSAPNAPTNVQVTDACGLAMAISWDAATDGESEIRGYDVYVDGNKINTGGYVYNTSFIISELNPSTDYDVEVIAVDAGYNESAPSTNLVASTIEYSVGDNMGINNGKMTITMESISWNDGIGINPPGFHKKGEYPDARFFELMDDFQPGNYRMMWDWGLAGSCDSYTAPELITGPSQPYTIGDFMDIANRYNAYAMLSVSLQDDAVFTQDPDYFNHLLEYFCGPTTTTWGTERDWEGYSEPLINNCKGLVIEFGNEVWGGDGHCIPLGEDYDEYAQWCREMDSIIKANEYYDSTKIFTCYSGRNPTPAQSYGLNKKLYTNDKKRVDWVALSGYMGGNFDYSPAIDPGKSELDYLKNAIGLMAINLSGLVDTKKDMLALATEIKPIWFYESNITTSSYSGRFGQALIATDYWAGSMEEGVIVSAFSWDGGQWKIYNPNWDKKLPLFHTSAFFNNHCKGHILKTDFVSNSEIKDANGNVIDIEAIGTYAYSDDTSMTLLLVNRDFEANAFVQVNIADTLTFDSNATKYIFTSDHYSSYETDIDTVPFTLSDSMMIKIPAGGLVFVRLSGLKQSLERLPVAAYQNYKLATGVEISCQGDCVIDSDAGILILESSVTPADAFVDVVNWEIIGENYGAQSSGYMDNGLIVKASGECGGDGTITIRASAMGDPSVYNEITIDISNQESPGGCQVQNAQENEYVVSMYPNPVNDMLNIQASQIIQSVSIRDISGKTLVNKSVNSNELKISMLDYAAGVYIVEINLANHNKILKKLLIN